MTKVVSKAGQGEVGGYMYTRRKKSIIENLIDKSILFDTLKSIS